MIDGLKLTMTGEELRARLGERVKDHEERAEWYKKEAKGEPGEHDDEDDEERACIFPEHMGEYEMELHEWRARVLGYIRDHIEGGEVYRLGEEDLEFGEILPEKPGCVEQEEFERETRADFIMERLAREMGSLSSAGFALASRAFAPDDSDGSKKPNEPQ
jgi:hypothetical protein